MSFSNLREFFCLHRKYLVANMVTRNLKVKYRRSVLGVFWTLLYPMAMAGVYYFVFQLILKVQIPHYLVLVMTGVIPWSFFSQSVVESVDSITGNWGLVTKVPMPIQVFPWVGVLTNFVTLCLAMPVILTIALLSQAPLGASLLALPFLMFGLLAMTYGTSLIVAMLSVWFRDLKHLTTISLQIWFYATPVLYLESMVPAQFAWIEWANPLAGVFGAFHRVLIFGEWPLLTQWISLLGWSLFSLAAAQALQRTYGHEIVEAV